MSQRSIFLVIIFLVFIGGGLLLINKNKPKDLQYISTVNNIQTKAIMKLTSSEFINNQTIPAKYTCDGQNINPPLTISSVPENAKSLALIMDDPDAPSGAFTHWFMWNIPPELTEIPSMSVPAGAEVGRNDAGQIGYMGPCPPSGTHHYFFKLYALDSILSLSPSVKKEELEKATIDHIIEKTELVGLYSRK